MSLRGANRLSVPDATWQSRAIHGGYASLAQVLRDGKRAWGNLGLPIHKSARTILHTRLAPEREKSSSPQLTTMITQNM